MGKKQCPQCGMWVSDDDRLSGQCPSCKSFFESEIPGGTPQVASTPTSVPNVTPVIQTHSPESPTERARRTSGLWSAWWVIPIALVAMRACNVAMRNSNNRQRPNYEYRYEPNSYRSQPRLEQEFTMGPETEVRPDPNPIDPFSIELPEPRPFDRLELPPNAPDHGEDSP